MHKWLACHLGEELLLSPFWMYQTVLCLAWTCQNMLWQVHLWSSGLPQMLLALRFPRHKLCPSCWLLSVVLSALPTFDWSSWGRLLVLGYSEDVEDFSISFISMKACTFLVSTLYASWVRFPLKNLRSLDMKTKLSQLKVMLALAVSSRAIMLYSWGAADFSINHHIIHNVVDIGIPLSTLSSLSWDISPMILSPNNSCSHLNFLHGVWMLSLDCFLHPVWHTNTQTWHLAW